MISAMPTTNRTSASKTSSTSTTSSGTNKTTMATTSAMSPDPTLAPSIPGEKSRPKMPTTMVAMAHNNRPKAIRYTKVSNARFGSDNTMIARKTIPSPLIISTNLSHPGLLTSIFAKRQNRRLTGTHHYLDTFEEEIEDIPRPQIWHAQRRNCMSECLTETTMQANLCLTKYWYSVATAHSATKLLVKSRLENVRAVS